MGWPSSILERFQKAAQWEREIESLLYNIKREKSHSRKQVKCNERWSGWSGRALSRKRWGSVIAAGLKVLRSSGGPKLTPRFVTLKKHKSEKAYSDKSFDCRRSKGQKNSESGSLFSVAPVRFDYFESLSTNQRKFMLAWEKC